MNPLPDSLRSRFAPKQAEPADQRPQQSGSALSLSLPLRTAQNGTPLCSQLNTPRDAHCPISFRDRVTKCAQMHQQRAGPGTARDLERHLLDHGITPIYQPKACVNAPVISTQEPMDVSDVRSFVSRPAPKGCGPIQCYVRTHANADRLFPRYELYTSEGDRFLLSTRKRKKSMTSNYIISLDPDDISRKTGNFFGKIRSNFLGTEFWFYDKAARHDFQDSILNKRAELGAVTYEKNILGLGGPRKMTVIIPAINAKEDKPYVFRPMILPSAHCLLTKHRSGQDQTKMLVMHNKQPVWNKQLNAYCLNFQGRVTEPSVRNFQLATEADQDYVVLQFGKIGKGLYNLDYQHPMSALQAFAVCITSMDYKIACE